MLLSAPEHIKDEWVPGRWGRSETRQQLRALPAWSRERGSMSVLRKGDAGKFLEYSVEVCEIGIAVGLPRGLNW